MRAFWASSASMPKAPLLIDPPVLHSPARPRCRSSGGHPDNWDCPLDSWAGGAAALGVPSTWPVRVRRNRDRAFFGSADRDLRLRCTGYEIERTRLRIRHEDCYRLLVVDLHYGFVPEGGSSADGQRS